MSYILGRCPSVEVSPPCNLSAADITKTNLEPPQVTDELAVALIVAMTRRDMGKDDQ